MSFFFISQFFLKSKQFLVIFLIILILITTCFQNTRAELHIFLVKKKNLETFNDIKIFEMFSFVTRVIKKLKVLIRYKENIEN